MARKLASLQIVDSIDDIVGKDKIGLGHILGWNVIVDKTTTSVGRKGVFFEVDSILPFHPAWKFLESRNPFPYRLKTLKMAGHISQGLFVDVRELSGIQVDTPLEDLPVGYDLTEVLGITKWDPQETMEGRGADSAGPFPWQVPRTDELRIQSHPEMLEEMAPRRVYVTEKLDGSSLTLFWNNESGEFEAWVCSRTRRVKDGTNWWWEAARNTGLLEKMREVPDLVYQGEVVGSGIQKNILRLNKLQAYGFNLWSRADQRYLNFGEFKNICNLYDVPTVPILLEDTYLPTCINDMGTEILDLDALLEMARGSYRDYPDVLKEGIVIRPMVEATSVHGRLSFKVESDIYRLKND